MSPLEGNWAKDTQDSVLIVQLHVSLQLFQDRDLFVFWVFLFLNERGERGRGRPQELLQVWFQTTAIKNIAIKKVVIFLLVEALAFNL